MYSRPRTTQEPEFCPNPTCRFYDRITAGESQWHTDHGRFYTKARGWIQRFRCRSCGKCCSTQTFSVHYWTHSTNDLTWLLQSLYTSSGLRQSARFAGVSYRVIQNRVRRLARNCLAVMDAVLSDTQLSEDLAMDGFQSFTRSQQHPNNFTSVVGHDSQFFYSVVHTLFRRGGRMTQRQRAYRQLIDSIWRPDPRALLHDCSSMLADLTPFIGSACRRRGRMRLLTDCHQSYPQAIASVPALQAEVDSGRLVHETTSSRLPRTKKNPLFAVNYLDRQIRKNMGEHVRETVKQGREVNCQMERMAIFMVMHNFLTPHRVGDEVSVAATTQHATVACVGSPIVTALLRRLVSRRHVWGHCRARHEWIRRIWHHEYENPPQVGVRGGQVVWRFVALGFRELPAHFLA